VIAIALMYLAAKLSKFEVKDWEARTPKHRYQLPFICFNCFVERFFTSKDTVVVLFPTVYLN
jgi:hypothetical protein